MSIGQYLLGGAAGLAFGLLVAAGNTLLLRRSLQRAKQTQGTVMGTSGLRQVINLAALVLVYLTSTYRGYAQGMSNMKPTTVSQILEVVGKVTVGLVLAWSFTRAGKSLPVA